MYWSPCVGSFSTQDGVRPARTSSALQPVRSIHFILHFPFHSTLHVMHWCCTTSLLLVTAELLDVVCSCLNIETLINTCSPVTYEALNPWLVIWTDHLPCLGAGGLRGSNKTGALLIYIKYTSFGRKKSSQNDCGCLSSPAVALATLRCCNTAVAATAHPVGKTSRLVVVGVKTSTCCHTEHTERPTTHRGRTNRSTLWRQLRPEHGWGDLRNAQHDDQGQEYTRRERGEDSGDLR